MKRIIIIVFASAALLLAGYILYRYFFYTCCALPPKSAPVISDEQNNDQILNNPDLLYAKRALIGLCNTKSGDGGSCHFNTYLYASGKLIIESGELAMTPDGEKSTAYPTIQKNLNKIMIVQITEQIRNSIIKNESCKTDITRIVTDVYVTYYVNLDGIKKEVRFPACEAEFNKVDQLINTAIGE
jgi:hypothetical protein